MRKSLPWQRLDSCLLQPEALSGFFKLQLRVNIVDRKIVNDNYRNAWITYLLTINSVRKGQEDFWNHPRRQGWEAPLLVGIEQLWSVYYDRAWGCTECHCSRNGRPWILFADASSWSPPVMMLWCMMKHSIEIKYFLVMGLFIQTCKEDTAIIKDELFHLHRITPPTYQSSINQCDLPVAHFRSMVFIPPSITVPPIIQRWIGCFVKRLKTLAKNEASPAAKFNS